MKNSKVKNFEAEISTEISKQKQSILTQVAKHLANFDTIEFEVFSNESVYKGETKNKIFFTYCDHYKANLGTWMEVGKLTHPHTNYEDRGYIKGAATDLDGYIKLRSANQLVHNFDVVARIYYPKFQKSIHRNMYISQCDAIVDAATKEIAQFIVSQQQTMNQRLKELTNCSLLHYVKNI